MEDKFLSIEEVLEQLSKDKATEDFASRLRIKFSEENER